MAEKKRILMYGRTNSGKTAQLGVLAEYIKRTTGKNTRLYTADKGGTKTIDPHITLGVVEAVELLDSNPFIFLYNAVRGNVRAADGRWIAGDNTNIGMFAFESMRAFAEEIMRVCVEKAAGGTNIGGGANISFNVQGDEQTLKVSGSNMAMFGVVQNRMQDEIWQSFKLDAPFIVWTSSVSKNDDQDAGGKVLGPDVIGKAMTADVPRWFDLTFRIDVLPAQGGKPERHPLYLGTHVDVGAGNAAGLGNIRRPLDAEPLKELVIEPANIVKALEMLEKGEDAATEVIRKRLGLK